MHNNNQHYSQTHTLGLDMSLFAQVGLRKTDNESPNHHKKETFKRRTIPETK